MFQNILQYFSQPDQDEVIAYQYKIPSSITVCVGKDHEYFIAKVEKINDKKLDKDTFLIEAKTIPSLVHEVNDMLLTYLDFPDRIKPKMPQLLPPEFEMKTLLSLKNSLHKELEFAK